MDERELDAAAESEWCALVAAGMPDVAPDLRGVVRSAFMAGFMVGARWYSRQLVMRAAQQPEVLN